MATLHFVKDGKRPNGDRVTRGFDLPLELAATHLGALETRFVNDAPTFNESQAADDWAPFRHVVLEVLVGESSAAFPNPGFYYFVGLDPVKCQELVGVSTPQI